jgi:hypothetical protein
VCRAALYSPRAADLPVWGATVKVLYMSYCVEAKRVGGGPVRDRAAERRTAAVPSGISAVVVMLCYVVACMRLDVIAATVCMFVLVCVSAACIVRFFLIAARLAQAQTVRAVSEQ